MQINISVKYIFLKVLFYEFSFEVSMKLEHNAKYTIIDF